MSDLSINGQPVQNVKIRELKKGTSLEEAQATLESQPDGQDAIGFTVGEKAYIAYGKGLKDVCDMDNLALDGQAGKVAFFENEDNTFAEGFLRPGATVTKPVMDWWTSRQAYAEAHPIGRLPGAIALGMGTMAVSTALMAPFAVGMGIGTKIRSLFNDESVVDTLTQK